MPMKVSRLIYPSIFLIIFLSILLVAQSNYKPVKVTPEIKRITKIDRQKLQDGIETFQGELDWGEMWTVDDSEKRLEDGWWFYVAALSSMFCNILNLL